jgi:threonine aldolase
MIIDLRSDTVTRPTKEMLEAMFSAEIGDDVLGDDPTVKALESKAAKMFGMDDALFCASGTMTNQIALKAYLNAGTEVICDKNSHIYLYEGGGIAANCHASVKLLDGHKGRIRAAQVQEAINNPDDIHLPISTLVSLENTMNKGGGSVYEFSEILKIAQVCKEKDLKFHLDGARLFNALVETSERAEDYGKVFDSISICLSKGLGAPVGSLLLGQADFIKKGRRIRKSFGGGWRQAGYLAAAGIYALDNNIHRLKDDHTLAKAIGGILETCSFVKDIYPIDTNIVIFELKKHWQVSDFVDTLKAKGVLAVSFGPTLVRLVTHLDFKSENLSQLAKIFKSIY